VATEGTEEDLATYQEFDEYASLTGFLKKHLEFKTVDSQLQLMEAPDSREALLVASGMSKPPFNAFLLQDDCEFPLEVIYGLPQRWIKDYLEEIPSLSKAKYLHFFNHWISTTLSNPSYIRRRKDKMLEELGETVEKKVGVSKEEVVFVPIAYYSDGIQYSEAIYEYVSEAILRLMGFYVVKDYRPWNTGKMPDLSAFRTLEIKEMIDLLRKRKLLKFGAANEELQMISLLGRVEPEPLLTSPAEIESVVVEVKTLASRYATFPQLHTDLYETGDLYDMGLAGAPDLSPELQDKTLGGLSLKKNGEIVAFYPSEKLVRYSTDESQKLRKRELRSVLGLFKLELLKNVGMEEAVRLVSTGEELTYEQFIDKLADVEPEKILDLVETKIPES
jgi:hypothetical protein